MIVQKHYHCYGDKYVPSGTMEPVIKILKKVQFNFKPRCAGSLRDVILNSLQQLGWSGKTKISGDLRITITSINNGIGLCLQTGNMARFYADLMKLQLLYSKGKISAAIYILPIKNVAKKMGDNVANFERLKDELSIFKDIITVPIVVIGLEEEE